MDAKKSAQNGTALSDRLHSTAHRPIVESSARDDLWGAVPAGSVELRGDNVSGWLRGKLGRTLAKDPEAMKVVDAPTIPDFRLFDPPIGTIG